MAQFCMYSGITVVKKLANKHVDEPKRRDTANCFGIITKVLTPNSTFRNPKSQTIAEIPNHCRNPKLLPKSKTIAKIQTIAEIPNHCRNPKSLPKSNPLPKSKTRAPN
ncbi:unnamed protein product [Rhizophagus irregularis]|nr:unnamed protein product [Rhizophagus irregularis]